MYCLTARGAWQPEIKVLAGLDPLTAVKEALFHDSLLASVGLLAIFAFLGSWQLQSSHGVLPMCLSLCPNFSFYKDTVTLDWGPHQQPYLNFIICKDPFSK